MARIRGNARSNGLSGRGGPDSIFGLGGNDTLKGKGGNDRLFGGTGADRLFGGIGDDQLYGGSGRDKLYGGIGSDILDGGAGGDRLEGGAGDDLYIWSAGDTIVENVFGGTDTVIVNDRFLTGFTMAAEVENLTLVDAESNVVVVGNNSNNAINGSGSFGFFYGLGGNDVIIGGSGVDADDYIDGGLGADVMFGGSGEDTYIVDNAADVVVEPNLVGDDKIIASVSYTLPFAVERLELAAGAGDINATGTAADDEELVGNAGANRITGLGGGDELYGGLGGDRFYYTHIDDSTFRITGGLDRVWDFAAGQGDKVDLSLLDWNTGNAVDDDFVFMGTAGFNAAGQVRVTENYSDGFSGTQGVLVEVNTAGTTGAEMSIYLAFANGPVAAGWFEL